MKSMIITLFILLISIMNPSYACTCFGGSGPSYAGLRTLTIMSCQNNVCNKAVAVGYQLMDEVVRYSYPEDEKQVLQDNVEMLPFQVTYPANTVSSIPLAQQKFPILNGVYKIIFYDNEKNGITSFNGPTPQAFVDVKQLSDQPNDGYIAEQASKYQNAHDFYLTVMLASVTLYNTVYALGVIALMTYLALLFFTSICVLTYRKLSDKTMSIMLDSRTYLNDYPLYLVYFMTAFLFTAFMPMLQLQYEVMMRSYLMISACYVALTLLFLMVFCYQHYKMWKAEPVGFFDIDFI